MEYVFPMDSSWMESTDEKKMMCSLYGNWADYKTAIQLTYDESVQEYSATLREKGACHPLHFMNCAEYYKKWLKSQNDVRAFN